MKKTLTRISIFIFVFMGLFLLSPNKELKASNSAFIAKNGNVEVYRGNSMWSAINAVSNNGTIILNRNMAFTTAEYTINKSLTFDLNGYRFGKTAEETPFFQVNNNGKLTITSSRVGGLLYAPGEVVQVNRTTAAGAVPELTINGHATLNSTGDNNIVTIRNISGIVRINGNATINNEKHYNAIWQHYLNGSSQPQLYISENPHIHGLSLATSASWGGLVEISGGYFYNRTNDNINFIRPLQSSGPATINIKGGYFEQDSIDKLLSGNATINADGYQINPHNKIDGKWYETLRHGTNTFDLKGLNWKNDAPYPYDFLGHHYSYPTANDIEIVKGLTFAGWYNDASYTVGPYTGKNAGLIEDRNLHARFTYEVIFDPNTADNTGNPFLDPHTGSMSKQTFNYGNKVYNVIPQNKFERQGYKFLGWSVNKNAKEPTVAFDNTQRWNFDGRVGDGKLTLYAIWEPIHRGSSYHVHYLFEQLDGSYKEDTSQKTNFYSQAGATSNPGIKDFTGYSVSNSQEHLDARRVLVHGDGRSIVKIYYNLDKYNVVFDIGKGSTVDNIDVYKNKNIYESYEYDPDVGKLTVRVKRGRNITVPVITTSESNPYHYRGIVGSVNNITENKNIVYHKVAKTYTYTFIVDGSVVNGNDIVQTRQQTFGEQIIYPTTLNPDGLFFYEYRDLNGNVLDTIDHRGDLTLYAYFRKGKPTSPIKVVQSSNKHLVFSKYNNYEYKLLDNNGKDTLGYEWSHTSTFTNLNPNTKYFVAVRLEYELENEYIVEPEFSNDVFGITLENINGKLGLEEKGTSLILSNLLPNTTYVLKDPQGNIIIGEVVLNKVMFKDLNPETNYKLLSRDRYWKHGQANVYDFFPVKDNSGAQRNITTSPKFEIKDGNNEVIITENLENKVVIEVKPENEYSFDGGATWVSGTVNPNDENNFLLEVDSDLLGKNEDILVRNKTNPTFPSKVDVYYDGIEPFGNELDHLNDDGFLHPKNDFIYYDGNTLLEPNIDGLIDLSNVSDLQVSRKPQGSYVESDKVSITPINRPELTEEELVINTTNVTENSIILTNVKDNLDYYIKVNDELDNLVNRPSEEILDIIDEIKDRLDEAESIEEVEDIIADAIDAIEEQLEAETKEEELANLFKQLQDKYNEYAVTDKYQYSDEGLDELDGIYNPVKDLYENKAATIEDILEAIDELDKVEIIVTESEVRPNINDDKGLARDEAHGFVEFAGENDTKLDKGTKLVVDIIVKLTNVETVVKHIDNKDLVDKANVKDSNDLYKDLRHKEIYGQLDIYLVDHDGNRIDSNEVPKGKYTVSMLIPTRLRNKENIYVVYLGDEVVEVFNITKEGNWITFETDHFSHFYLIGDPDTPIRVINLWWLIILLAIIILIEMVLILTKNKERKRIKKANVFLLPLLVTIVEPLPAWTIIMIEIVIITVLLLLLIYVLLNKIFRRKRLLVIENTVLKEKIVISPIEESEETYQNIDTTRTIYDYSYTARLHLNSEDANFRYNTIKNHILNHEGLSSAISWDEEIFTVNDKTIIKLKLREDTIVMFIGLKLKHIDLKYEVMDYSIIDSETFTGTIKTIKNLDQMSNAIELISQLMRDQKIKEDKNYNLSDFALLPIAEEQLIEQGLIKVEVENYTKKAKVSESRN